MPTRSNKSARRAPSAPAPDARDRLVQAAIAEIEARGLGRLTVRAVAAASGMNIAAVNYYFRSKEELVATALDAALAHMLADAKAMLARMAETPYATLAELLEYLLEGSLRYPRISKAQLHDAFVADDYSGRFFTIFAPVLEQLRDALRAAVPGLAERSAARRVVAALSAVFFPAFFGPMYGVLGALDSPAERQQYAAELARQALAPATPEPRGPGPKKPARARAK